MDWSVDYGDGPKPCQVPHVWAQDVDVRWEGPAIYRTTVDSEKTKWLVFWGASYEAKVILNGKLALVHRGIWDAFKVRLDPGTTDVRVEVTKNGGLTFPVKDVLSGFLPYVHSTFGGLFRGVELLDEEPELDHGRVPSRLWVEGTKLLIDGEPWFMRGVLSWGWYPDLSSPHPPRSVMRQEARRIKLLGFNLVKFCLWLPPHDMFQILEDEGLWAWVELPLWLPSDTMDLDSAFTECERIVRQYRHHDRIIAWTCGCELSHSTPHEFRQRLYQMVKDLTGCPLVKDNSGGAEMYGGDLREYGDFNDYHPYCDTMFYPTVVETLRNGPREAKPILLGEYNDYDTYRPLHQLSAGKPYWTSDDPKLNDQGVRWQHDVPGVLASRSSWLSPEVEDLLRSKSLDKSRWIRDFVTRTVIQENDVSGYVVTGLADTPISTSGVLDLPSLTGVFEDVTAFLVPHRRPPWVDGGNRPGWSDPINVFPGSCTIQIGLRATRGWNEEVTIRFDGGEAESMLVHVSPDTPSVIATLSRDFVAGVQQTLTIDPGNGRFTVSCFERFDWDDYPGWAAEKPLGATGADGDWAAVVDTELPKNGIVILDNVGTMAVPFWRECVQWNTSGVDLLDSWDFLFPVSCDKVIDPVWLEHELPGAEWLLTRVDTRTYQRQPCLARRGSRVVTTLRPWGGLGVQPLGIEHNPAGCELMRILIKLATCN